MKPPASIYLLVAYALQACNDGRFSPAHGISQTGKRGYQILAAKHESLTLPAIRVALQSVREQDYHALQAYTQMVVTYAFTGFLASEPFFYTPVRDKVAELVHLLRGACAIHEKYFMWLARGPFKDCLEILNPNPSFDRNTLVIRNWHHWCLN